MNKSIMIVGVGGQGTLLASRILGSALLDCGYDVKVSEVHGMSQRGGSVVTYVRCGEKVASPIIEKGEAIIGGNKVVYNGETPLILQDSDSQSSNYFNGTIAQNTQRYDIVVIHPNSNAEYIMGTPTTLGDPINIPKCPSNSLTVAILNFSYDANIYDHGTFTHIISNI